MKRLSVFLASVSLATTLSAQDPFADMDRIFQMQLKQMQMMQQQMDRMFRNFEQNLNAPVAGKMPILVHSSGVLSSGFVDKGDKYELQIKVNDLKNSKVKITTDNGMLTVEVTENKKIEKSHGNYGKIISYTNSNSVQSFTLPPDADPASIKAEQKDNVITVYVAKKAPAKVIPIQKSDSNSTKK